MAKTVYVMVPVETGLVFDPRTGNWRIDAVPPAWFLELTDGGNDDPLPSCLADLDQPEPASSCRPGRGPCRRRHPHASARRAA